MIRRIILENYMAHVRTVIEPAAGLTVLIGPNNCGKSAVAHALEMICYNSDAASFAIRHGTKKATVTIEIQDEDATVHTLVWWRTKATAGYIIDGREISGMGKGKTPDDLHRYLRMPEVPSSTGKPFHIHFGLQKEPIFLLDDPPSRAAQFFASSSDADRLMEMQRRHKQKEVNARRDRDRLDQEITRLDQQLGELTPLPALSEELAKLEADFSAINASQFQSQALAKSIDAHRQAALLERNCLSYAKALAGLRAPPEFQVPAPLSNLIGGIESTARNESVNRAKLGVLFPLKIAPALADTSALIRLVDDLTRGRRRLQHSADAVSATRSLSTIPAQGDVQALAQTVNGLTRLTAAVQWQQAKNDALIKLRDVPASPSPAPLALLFEAMQSAIDKLARLEARHHLLGRLPLVPRQTDLGQLNDLADRIDRATALASQAHSALRRSQQKLDDLREQIELFVQENPRCQSCGQSVSAELILTGDHDHE